ncbi:hypothetical protein SAMN05421820_103504 [Pedobacter steynii]|uniref:Uncharacterized protein n=1 Tax=Pedobacter steynii TaxID=430522 RepID=A0A1G9S8U4_9SPHI|nr:hypothetical protein SAMN05421820_103504 [Pedobacter steynii]
MKALTTRKSMIRPIIMIIISENPTFTPYIIIFALFFKVYNKNAKQ